SPVDLVAEVRRVEPREAVNLLASQFGFEGIAPPAKKLLQLWHAQPTPGRAEASGATIDWMRLLTFGDRGQLRASAHNAATILTHDPHWRGALCFDERAVRSMFVQDPPWHDDYRGARPRGARPVTDADAIL